MNPRLWLALFTLPPLVGLACSSSSNPTSPLRERDAATPDGAAEAGQCGVLYQACCNHDACAGGLSCEAKVCVMPLDAGDSGAECQSDMDCNEDAGVDAEALISFDASEDAAVPVGPYVCKAGACVCGGLTCDGRCMNVQTDPRHCGSCDAVCSQNEECTSGKCTCEKTVCPGVDGGGGGGATCVDLMTDNANCGGCGKVCNYTCSSGVCGPTVLAKAALGPITLDSSNGTLIFQAGIPEEGFYACPTSGCSLAPSFLTAFSGVLGTYVFNANGLLATAGTFFALTEDSNVLTCPDTGCTSMPMVGQALGTISLNSENAYWADFSDHIMTCPATGPCTSPTILATIPNLSSVVSDENNLYYSTATGCCDDIVSQVFVADFSAQNPTLIGTDTTGQGAVLMLASGGRAFWYDVGGIFTATLTSPKTNYFNTDVERVFSSDGTNLYFPDFGFADVASCPIGATCDAPAVVIASSGSILGPSVAVDDTNVYWFSNETLFKFHK